MGEGNDLCPMENNEKIEETILVYTSAWNETERGSIIAIIDQ
jgi:hypothetical protein